MAVTSDFRLPIPEAVRPFIRDVENGLPPDVRIRFTVGEPDLFNAEPISSQLYRKHDLIYHLCPFPAGSRIWCVEHEKDAREYRFLISETDAVMFSQSETWLNCLGLERILLRHGKIMLHASAVVYQGRALLFSAPSGVGKSTQAGLWARYEHTPIINGDKVILGFRQDKCFAYGGPIAGTSGIYTDLCAPVSGIAMIRQAGENRIRAMTLKERLLALYAEAIKSKWDTSYNAELLSILHRISTEVPVFLMACLPDESAVQYLKQYMDP